jgi:hypothetical protein
MPLTNQRCTLTFGIFLFFPLLLSIRLQAQPLNGYLTGRIIDGTNFKPLSSCRIAKDISGKWTSSAADGTYSLTLAEGLHSLRYQAEGFQAKIIQNIFIRYKSFQKQN